MSTEKGCVKFSSKVRVEMGVPYFYRDSVPTGLKEVLGIKWKDVRVNYA